MKLVTSSRRLADAVDALKFGAPVTHVYNPLRYARAPHEQYLRRYGEATGRVVLLGMNPGPFGMAQTGVPFGEVSLVREFLRIDGRVDRPEHEHPRRPIDGMACARSEVSGARLWGWARERFGSPEKFFARFFVMNYCPLVFMDEGGRNVTPDKLPPDERAPLEAACDRALRDAIGWLAPIYVVGVGTFAEKRARAALGGGVPIGQILHPSPASPLANRGWAEAADRDFAKLGIAVP